MEWISVCLKSDAKWCLQCQHCPTRPKIRPHRLYEIDRPEGVNLSNIAMLYLKCLNSDLFGTIINKHSALLSDFWLTSQFFVALQFRLVLVSPF